MSLGASDFSRYCNTAASQDTSPIPLVHILVPHEQEDGPRSASEDPAVPAPIVAPTAPVVAPADPKRGFGYWMSGQEGVAAVLWLLAAWALFFGSGLMGSIWLGALAYAATASCGSTGCSSGRSQGAPEASLGLRE